MSSAVSLRRSPEEYIAFERLQEIRSEYDDGVLRAMSGASREHNVIAGNLFATIHSQLRRGPCEAYSNDMRVAVELGRFYTYPDLAVVCGGPRFLDNQSDTLLNPTVLFEVLSPSTESYDRGRKFARYQTIASLREVVLISQREPRVERFERQGDGRWTLADDLSGLDDTLRLSSVDVTIPLSEIYERIVFPEAPPIEPGLPPTILPNGNLPI